MLVPVWVTPTRAHTRASEPMATKTIAKAPRPHDAPKRKPKPPKSGIGSVALPASYADGASWMCGCPWMQHQGSHRPDPYCKHTLGVHALLEGKQDAPLEYRPDIVSRGGSLGYVPEGCDNAWRAWKVRSERDLDEAYEVLRYTDKKPDGA